MPNLGALVQTAMNAATRESVTGNLTLERPAYDASGNATASSLTQTVKAVADATTKYRPGQAQEWTNATFVVFVSSRALSWAPALGDVATWAGVEGTITAIDPLAPAGSIIGYYLAVGAAG